MLGMLWLYIDFFIRREDRTTIYILLYSYYYCIREVIAIIWNMARWRSVTVGIGHWCFCICFIVCRPVDLGMLRGAAAVNQQQGLAVLAALQTPFHGTDRSVDGRYFFFLFFCSVCIHDSPHRGFYYVIAFSFFIFYEWIMPPPPRDPSNNGLFSFPVQRWGASIVAAYHWFSGPWHRVSTSGLWNGPPTE